MRTAGLLLAATLVSGCATRVDRVFGVPGRLNTGSYGAQPGYEVKLVSAKEGPAEVVGDDGSLCRLTPERFARVAVGDWLVCEWTIAA